MRAPALADAVTHLPWLSPCAASLVALARQPVAVGWETVRFDPGAVLLLVSRSSACQTLSSLSFVPAALRDPAVLDEALRQWDEGGPKSVDWNEPAVRPVYQAALTYARLAAYLAQRTGACDPDNAWAAGLLAPVGWFAVAVVAPEQVTACLTDPEWGRQPLAVQQRHWGLDQAAIARRLARHWRLPRWLAAVTGHLSLPAATASLVGADPDVFRIVQLAVGLAQQHLGCRLRLFPGADAIGFAAAEGEETRRGIAALLETPPAPLNWAVSPDPTLVRELLMLGAENRRRTGAPVLEELERDLDHLHRTLQELQTGADDRLRTQKLNAMAEFAAGAGHEINNPLAVISGQAQYLLHQETEPARRKALQTIVNQAQRIHQLLNALMEYARPQRPQKQDVDLPRLLQDVTASLADLAAQRRVQLQGPAPEPAVILSADPRQLHLAITCLLQNAVEAAAADGWARVSVEVPSPDRVDVVVEDSGSGLSRAQREHLFDPFYSGRQAGRGRGLGLPIAWRVAQEHGGDLRYDERPQGPTRFVLSLPREVSDPRTTVSDQPSAVSNQPSQINGHCLSLTADR